MSAKNFHHNGHDYTVCPVENSERYTVIRDNRQTRYTDDVNLYLSTEFPEVRQQIAAMFEKQD